MLGRPSRVPVPSQSGSTNSSSLYSHFQIFSKKYPFSHPNRNNDVAPKAAMVKNDQDYMQTVQCMSIEPASKNILDATHVTSRRRNQHRGTYHTPQCQGTQANGSIQQRRFLRARHEEQHKATRQMGAQTWAGK